MRYLSLCCIVKDETPFLREWITYHALLGVEHFYIYDHMSQAPVQETLDGFVPPELVTVARVDGIAPQVPVYFDCIQRYGAAWRWMGFIDLDEFICPLRDEDFRVFLSEFEAYKAFGLPWDMFSSAGHLGRPPGLVIENYRRRFSESSSEFSPHIKSFVDPRHVKAATHPHAFILQDEHRTVTEDHRPMPPGSPITACLKHKAKLNHYHYRSQQDFEEKIRRGFAIPVSHQRTMESFYTQAGCPDEHDGSMDRFIPRVAAALAEPRLRPSASALEGDVPLEEYMAKAGDLEKIGDLTRAQTCLCHAALHHPQSAPLWIQRARLARLSACYDRADAFLRQAVSLNETTAYLRELQQLRLAQGRREEVVYIEKYVRKYTAGKEAT